MLQTPPHLDAAETAFLERALRYVEAEAYNTVIPPMEGRLNVPVVPAPPGAKTTSYRQYTRVGVAKWITEAGQDLPTTSFYVKEFVHQFYMLGASYQYTYKDLLAASYASQNGGFPINIDMEEATAAQEAIEKKFDNVARVGSADGLSPSLGLLGLLNQPNANIYTVATGGGGGTTWDTKAPDEIIADMTGIVASQVASTFKRFKPDTLLLPILQYETIAGTSMGDGRSDTILSYFEKTNKHIKRVDSWQFLDQAGSGNTDRMVAYINDKRYVRHMISMEFTQLAAQLHGVTYKIPCLGETAGVISPYPISISYGDGI